MCARLDAHVYHMEHARTDNSWFTNPFNNNKDLHDTLMEFDKDNFKSIMKIRII